MHSTKFNNKLKKIKVFKFKENKINNYKHQINIKINYNSQKVNPKRCQKNKMKIIAKDYLVINKKHFQSKIEKQL